MNSARHPRPLSRLAGFSAATLHEAAPGSAVLPCELRPVWAGAEVLGPAYTVEQEGGHNGWLHRAIYQAPPGAIIVVATDSPRYGYWGELMALAAMERGIGGLVIDGGVRDVDRLEALRFPVFAAAVCMRGTDKSLEESGGLGRPVVLGEARVSTGDAIVGDRDGVVALPPDEVADVAARAQARDHRESEIREAIREGRTLREIVLPSGSAPPSPTPES